jgi:hypothetical protein
VVGRKRHILTDTLGLMLAVNVHRAALQIATARRRSVARRAEAFLSSSASSATRRCQGRKIEAVVARTGF